MIRKWILLLLLMPCFILKTGAVTYNAPTVPEDAAQYMPENTESFGDGLSFILQEAFKSLAPNLTEAFEICASILIILLLLSLLRNFSDSANKILILIAVIAIGTLVLQSTKSLIQLGTETIHKTSTYGKLLLPVMTTAMAAQGGVTTSAALYTGTMFLTSLLTTLVSSVIVPMIYIYIAFCIADRVVHNQALSGMKHFIKWLSTWAVKLVLYISTGYLSITGVIAGSVDAAAVKAAKLAISGAVPVVGGILSDASETVLLSAKIMKNSVGIYGVLAFLAISIAPFLRIALHYLLMKATAAISTIFADKEICGLVNDISGAMGFILAMTGTVCLLFLISVVCFMKGVG